MLREYVNYSLKKEKGASSKDQTIPVFVMLFFFLVRYFTTPYLSFISWMYISMLPCFAVSALFGIKTDITTDIDKNKITHTHTAKQKHRKTKKRNRIKGNHCRPTYSANLLGVKHHGLPNSSLMPLAS